MLEYDRIGLEIEDLIRFFELHSGYTIQDLRSTLYRHEVFQKRIEFATLSASRYGIRAAGFADTAQKQPTTIARLFRRGLVKEIEGRSLRKRIDSLFFQINAQPDRLESAMNAEDGTYPWALMIRTFFMMVILQSESSTWCPQETASPLGGGVQPRSVVSCRSAARSVCMSRSSSSARRREASM